jgi:hypothetical protein
MNTLENETDTLTYAIKLKQDMYDYLSINFNDEIIVKLLETTVDTMDKYLDIIEKNTKELISNFQNREI